MQHLLFVCLLCQQVQAQIWQPLDIPLASRYDDVCFWGNQLGWACNSKGQIFHTADGGQQWTLQFDNGGNYLRSIEFMNDSVGFCGGLESGEWLYRTLDGGKNWVNITKLLPGLRGGICGLSCPGNNVVYGCGWWKSPAHIVKSSDGGFTWEIIEMSTWADRLVDIFFISPDSGWVSGSAKSLSDGGIILSTSDGGLTWHVKAQTKTYGDYVWKLQTPDSLHFFAAIERLDLGGNTQILKSSDGGASWYLRKVHNQPSRLQMIGFLDSLYGFCGWNDVFETQDGGENWQRVFLPDNGHLNRFWRMNSQTAVVSGKYVYRLDRESTGIPEQPVSPVAEPCRLHVSPNPGSGIVTIRVELDQATASWLAVGRLDGRGIPAVLWSGEFPSGEYQFSTDLQASGTGMYVVWLKTNFGTIHELVAVKPEH
ncbi:MAG: YCF48-related protein [Saprospiraceae bacterium]